jgi:hypothetical protein
MLSRLDSNSGVQVIFLTLISEEVGMMHACHDDQLSEEDFGNQVDRMIYSVDICHYLSPTIPVIFQRVCIQRSWESLCCLWSPLST